MNMSDKLVFILLNIYREFHDKTALNFILYKVQNFYIGKMCISVFYFIIYFHVGRQCMRQKTHINNREQKRRTRKINVLRNTQ